MITDANITAAIAWLIENQDETDSISNSTASSYFGSIITVAARNGIDVKEMAGTVKNSEYLAIGRAMSKEMCGSTLRICKRVVADPASRQLFFTFHLFFRRRGLARKKWRAPTEEPGGVLWETGVGLRRNFGVKLCGWH